MESTWRENDLYVFIARFGLTRNTRARETQPIARLRVGHSRDPRRPYRDSGRNSGRSGGIWERLARETGRNGCAARSLGNPSGGEYSAESGPQRLRKYPMDRTGGFKD